MRHLHAADAEFLEAFRDQGVSQAASVNTVAVVSRADEIGGGRVDAMVSARTVARRYRTEPALRGLCQDVVAVAGLLAETAAPSGRSSTPRSPSSPTSRGTASRPRCSPPTGSAPGHRHRGPVGRARRSPGPVGIFGLRLEPR